EAASAADVDRSLTLPDSPRLIVLGPVEETNCWMVSTEGHVVTEGEPFLLGLASLFTSFYNFNIQYQNEACCTLEFIQ
ncbi:mpv17-like protein 2 isoform X1, partial [Clarias magur]